LCLTDLLRSQHGQSGSLVETFHITHRLSTVVDGVQKLAPLAIITIANFWVVELLTQLGHVV
jgi:hypothetical protein